MKSYKYFLRVSIVFFTTFILSSSLLQASSYEELKEELKKNYKKYNTIVNSSKDKDIICFFGKTGSEKSTLINYLSGIPLTGDDSDIDLSKEMKEKIKKAKEEDSDIPGVMEIGTGDSSTTTHPKSVEIKNMWFYDFPGFGDTGGVEKDLLNAHFYKNILEKAKSVRVVFVAGAGEIEEGRGESLKRLIKIAGNLMKESSIDGLTSLVITKAPTNKNWYKTVETMGTKIKGKCCNLEETEKKLSEAKRLNNLSEEKKLLNELEEKKLLNEKLNEWINKGRLARMFSPQGEEISQEEREPILKTIISNTTSGKITNLFLDAIIEGGIGDIMNTLYSSAQAKHAIQAQDKESADNAQIDQKECKYCLWRGHVLSENDRKHAKKTAKFLRHMEELEDDKLIQYLKDLQPKRYQEAIKQIFGLYINEQETENWVVKMSKIYKENSSTELTDKQKNILEQYIKPSMLEKFGLI